VGAELRDFFRNLKRLERLLRKAQTEELDAQEPRRFELESVIENLQHAEREAQEVADALPGTKGKVRELLNARAERVNAGIESLNKRKSELEAELQKQVLTDAAIENILTYARDVREGIEHAEPSDHRRVLEWLGVSVDVKDGCYKAHCVLGGWEEAIPYRKIRRGDAVAFDDSRIPT
jgi:sugar-specific transcriptional regulator TrmB